MLMELGRERDLERQNESPTPKRKKRDTGVCDSVCVCVCIIMDTLRYNEILQWLGGEEACVHYYGHDEIPKKYYGGWEKRVVVGGIQHV